MPPKSGAGKVKKPSAIGASQKAFPYEAGGTRTHNRRLKRPLLCPLSYRPMPLEARAPPPIHRVSDKGRAAFPGFPSVEADADGGGVGVKPFHLGQRGDHRGQMT